jgi:hypothetical protein
MPSRLQAEHDDNLGQESFMPLIPYDAAAAQHHATSPVRSFDLPDLTLVS